MMCSQKCICEYTYCINLELLPLYCVLKNAFVTIFTYYYGVASLIMCSQKCIYKYTYCIIMELLPLYCSHECVCEYTYCIIMELPLL